MKDKDIALVSGCIDHCGKPSEREAWERLRTVLAAEPTRAPCPACGGEMAMDAGNPPCRECGGNGVAPAKTEEVEQLYQHIAFVEAAIREYHRRVRKHLEQAVGSLPLPPLITAVRAPARAEALWKTLWLALLIALFFLVVLNPIALVRRLAG